MMRKAKLLVLFLALMVVFSSVSIAYAATAAPTGLKATVLGSSSIKLTWSAVSGATKYEVYQGVSNTAMTLAAATASTTYTGTSLTVSTTYYFKVRAIPASGVAGPYSAIVNAKTLAGIAAPTGVNAAAASNSQINIKWNAVSGATSYSVYRSTTSSGVYKKIATVTAKTYNNTGLAANTVYYYKVRAINASGEGVFSAVVSARTRPVIPVGLKAAALNYTSIKLTWNAVAGATKYIVYRSAASTGSFTKIGEASAVTSPTYTSTGLAANTNYYYKVSAVNAGGEGAMSAVATAKTLIAPPAAPTNLKASALSYNSIKLTWSAVAGDTKYIVYRSAASTGSFAKIGEAAAVASPTYTSTGLAANTSYYYKVSSVNVGGEGTMSATVTAKTLVAPPVAPTGLRGDPYDYYTVNLYWNAVPNAVKYHIYMAVSATGTYSSVGYSVNTSCSVNQLQPGTPYYFKVATVGASGEGPMCGFVGVQTVSAPPAPAAPGFSCVASTDVGNNQCEADFAPTASLGVYRMYDSTDGVHWNLCVDSTQLDFQHCFTYTDTNGTIEYLKFTAMNGPSESLGTYFTFAALVKPINFSYQTNAYGHISGNYGTITLHWNAVSGATRYRVVVRDDIDQITTPLFDGYASTNSITLNGLPVYISLNYYVLPYTGTMSGPIWGHTSASILGGY